MYFYFLPMSPSCLVFTCVCLVCVHIIMNRFICAFARRMDENRTRIQYELTLVASDSLNENHTKIIISVRDVNDLPPVFPQKNYTYTMDEEIAAPFRFLQVKNVAKKFLILFFLNDSIRCFLILLRYFSLLWPWMHWMEMTATALFALVLLNFFH